MNNFSKELLVSRYHRIWETEAAVVFVRHSQFLTKWIRRGGGGEPRVLSQPSDLYLCGGGGLSEVQVETK